MPLYLDVAKQIYSNQASTMEGWSDEQKMAKRKELVETLKKNPSLNRVSDVNQDTFLKLEENKEAYDKRVAHWDKMTAHQNKEARELSKPVKWSSYKELERNAELQGMGVDTDRDLPTGSLEIGFGDDPVKALKSALSAHYESDVRVFKSGKDIIYIDPNDGTPVKANPNAFGLIGQSIPVATEVGAALIGPKKGMPAKVVAGESAAASIGATTGEFIRLAVGKGLGAHDLSLQEMVKKSGIHGAWAGTITLGVGSIIASAKGLANLREGRLFNKDDVIEAGVPAKDADIVTDEVNQWIKSNGGKAEFKPTLGQKSEDVLAEGAESQLRRREEYAPAFRERDIQNIEAQKQALDIVGKQEPVAGKTVQDVTSERVGKRVGQATDIVDANRKQLDSEIERISSIQKESVGEPTIKFIQAKSEAAKKALDNTWDDVRQFGGFDPKKETYGIKLGREEGVNQLDSILKRQSKTATTKIGASSTKGMFTKSGEKVIARQQGKPIVDISKLEDLADYNREISRLKKRRRQMDINVTDQDAVDVDNVIRAMEKDRRLSLVKSGNEKLLKKIEDAELATAEFHNKYKRSVIGDLTAVNENNVPKIKSKSFVKNMMERTAKEVDDFYEVIKDSPEMVNQWKQGIANAYRRKVFPKVRDGVSRYSHEANEEFIAANEHILSKFFTKGEIEGFKKTGKLYEKVQSQTARLETFKKKAQDKWGSGVLTKLDPDNMVKFVTNNSGSWSSATGVGGVQTGLKKIDFVKNITRGHKDAWTGFQNKFKESLQSDILDTSTGKINSKALSKWVNDSGNAKTIIKVMGQGYYDDIAKLSKVMNMINKPLKSLAANEERKGWIQTIRAGAAPPLTRRGRAFTALLLFDSKRTHKAVANAILNQKTMKEVASLAEHDIVTRRIFEKAVSLGMALPDDE